MRIAIELFTRQRKDNMYERFTDRSRKVLQLANQEAMRFNHEYIGTEHILLGLIKEGSGVAANVLKNLEVDLRKVRLEVEKLVQSGPDIPGDGKLPQTPLAKRVVERSIEAARTLGHNYIGTEHLLLGLLSVEEGVAFQVLTNLGLKTADVGEECLALLGMGLDQGESSPKSKDQHLYNMLKTIKFKVANATVSNALVTLGEVYEILREIK